MNERRNNQACQCLLNYKYELFYHFENDILNV